MRMDPALTWEGIKQAWGVRPLTATRPAEWTTWWEEVFRELADRKGWYCQNRGAGAGRVAGEWLSLDHVIVERNEYTSYPLIVAEHENYALATREGTLASGDDPRARVEWALWKLLAIRADVRVLIAYPESVRRRDFNWACREIVRAANLNDPRLLLILGWWPAPAPTSDPGQIYSTYAADGAGSLVPLP